jgi:hypothetical protein
MQLQILKTLIEKSSLSPERLARANEVVEEALSTGALSTEQRDELVTLIQTESSEKHETASALQEVADSIDALLAATTV